MKSASRIRLIVAVGISITLTGCYSMQTLSDQSKKNKVYSGTIEHVEIECRHGACVDAPFSFILDTTLLPLTIPWTILNFVTASPEGNNECSVGANESDTKKVCKRLPNKPIKNGT